MYIYFLIGKRYVGITKQKPKDRWKNGNGYLTQQLVYRAIQKYGWHNIEHKILYEDLLEEEAKQKEKELINEWNTNNLMYGYNVTDGGEGVTGYKHNEETKKKISDIKKKQPYHIKFIEAMRQANINNKRTKEHIFNNSKAKWKKVIQLNINNEVIKRWDSLKEASETLHIAKGDISRVCNGKRKTAGRLYMEL